jgi:hypothetical protein
LDITARIYYFIQEIIEKNAKGKININYLIRLLFVALIIIEKIVEDGHFYNEFFLVLNLLNLNSIVKRLRICEMQKHEWYNS